MGKKLRYNIVTFCWILFYYKDEKKLYNSMVKTDYRIRHIGYYTLELEDKFWLLKLHGGYISALG
jgi:hypothetical protein